MIGFQELKNNREQVIETIEEFTSKSFTDITLKEMMAQVAEDSKLGCFWNIEEDLSDLVEYSFDTLRDLEDQKRTESTHVLEDMRIESSRELMKHI